MVPMIEVVKDVCCVSDNEVQVDWGFVYILI